MIKSEKSHHLVRLFSLGGLYSFFGSNLFGLGRNDILNKNRWEDDKLVVIV